MAAVVTVMTVAATGCSGPGDESAPGLPPVTPASLSSNLLPAILIDGEPAVRYSLEDRMAHYNVPGVSIAIMQDGEIQWARGWGMADVEGGRAVSETTLFQAASISKPVAALAAMSMVEDGLLELDGPINAHLTSWQVPDNAFTADSAVTLRGLMSHTAGLTVWGFPGYRKDQPWSSQGVIPTNVQVLDGLGNTDSVRVYKEPGISWQYSGGGYTVMEQAMEDVAGRSFHEIAAARVLQPAGMSSSTYAQPLPEGRWDEAARGYRGDGLEVEGEWHTYPEQAAAGLWTTPTDLLVLGQHLTQVLHGDVPSGVVSASALEEMITGHRSDEEGFDDYGLGFGVTGAGETRSFGHGGANEGFRAYWIVFPETGQGVAIMTNGDRGGTLYGEIMRGLSQAMGWSVWNAEVRTARALEPGEADAYAGDFEAESGNLVVTVLPRGDRLAVSVPGQGEFTLRADGEQEDTFFDPEDAQLIEFERDATGRVVTLIAGGSARLTRVDEAG